MNNVFKDFKVGIRFDLKGSTAGRDELENGMLPFDPKRDKKIAMKDNDFTKHFKHLVFVDNSEEAGHDPALPTIGEGSSVATMTGKNSAMMNAMQKKIKNEFEGKLEIFKRKKNNFY